MDMKELIRQIEREIPMAPEHGEPGDKRIFQEGNFRVSCLNGKSNMERLIKKLKKGYTRTRASAVSRPASVGPKKWWVVPKQTPLPADFYD